MVHEMQSVEIEHRILERSNARRWIESQLQGLQFLAYHSAPEPG
jgi:hypothetical protein